VLHACLVEDTGDVVADRLLGDVQRGGYLTVRHAARDTFEDGTLARRQIEKRERLAPMQC
jgi:hypothetical protein